MAWNARLKYYQTRVNTLRVANKRLMTKNRMLITTLKSLQEESAIQKEQLDIINDGMEELIQNEVANRRKKNPAKRYSSKIRVFAFTLFYYSPKAYSYLRTVFSLPSPETIRRWLHSIDCQPGFLSDVIESVGAKSGPKLYSLVVDSMSIRKQVQVKQGKVTGYCDFGGSIRAAGKENIMATEALVFLLVPLLSRTRYPIGFFFVDKIDSTLQSSLITHCLQLTASKSIEVVNVTCDGCPANLSTLRALGASIPDNPLFQHPDLPFEVKNCLFIHHIHRF